MGLLPEQVYKAVWGFAPGEAPPPFSHDDLTRDTDEPQEDPPRSDRGTLGGIMFRNTRYPALRFYAADRGFKFVGGRLVVISDESAAAVRAYAKAHPEMGITEVPDDSSEPAPVQEERPTELEPVSQTYSLDELPYSELRSMARSRGLSAGGSKTDLLARLVD